ncbi:MAG: sodium-dependent transporter [Alphaproteobacteria bacterium]|nr:MAG: sodium-dependent transporter [Alphaproteobacteria bacterium]
MERTSVHGNWSSRLAFILAAVGSAVGLGNIWKFPYEAGQGGGGAFVIVYLLFVFAIGVPVMIAELAVGRRGRASPPKAMANVAADEGRARGWSIVGWLGVVGAFLILSFYSVIGGWTLAYVMKALVGRLSGIDAAQSTAMFADLLAEPVSLLYWHAVFAFITVLIVARGIQAGLEKAVTWLMPALFALLLILVFYALSTGSGSRALAFLFMPDFSKLTADTVLQALGQAFFSLSLAMGAMMTYGAYVPENVSLPRSALVIASADTAVSLLAGLAIFPLVFRYGLDIGSGPGLIFETLPIAFGQMPGGLVVGTLFFLLLAIAALTSSISLLEPMVSWLEEHRGLRRSRSAIGAGIGVFLVGIGTVLSFNRWADIRLFGRNFFENIDFLTNNIMMPLGGFLLVIFTGWVVSRTAMRRELHSISDGQFALWRAMARYVCPVALALIFLSVVGVL